MTYAKFGRWQTDTCLRPGILDSICSNADVLEDASSKCDGKQTCEYNVVAGESHTYDPCPNIYKYTRLQFEIYPYSGQSFRNVAPTLQLRHSPIEMGVIKP